MKLFTFLALACAAFAADNSYMPLFNGKNLDGWEGDPVRAGYPWASRTLPQRDCRASQAASRRECRDYRPYDGAARRHPETGYAQSRALWKIVDAPSAASG